MVTPFWKAALAPDTDTVPPLVEDAEFAVEIDPPGLEQGTVDTLKAAGVILYRQH